MILIRIIRTGSKTRRQNSSYYSADVVTIKTLNNRFLKRGNRSENKTLSLKRRHKAIFARIFNYKSFIIKMRKIKRAKAAKAEKAVKSKHICV